MMKAWNSANQAGVWTAIFGTAIGFSSQFGQRLLSDPGGRVIGKCEE